jgi:site-specific DNA recombinase
METPKSVAIWIRVSTEDQVRGDSPEHHERRARAYAESKGWDVREVYRLDAVSGKSVMDQPETKRMLAHIRSGHITGLIFSKLARLARNTKELLEFAEIFRERGADLISLQESIDTSSPAGRLFYTMIAAMAQWEREEIADRVAASVPIRAKLGKPLGNEAPFGYRWEGGRLTIDAKEAPVRKLIYELFLEHKRKKSVARILNERGYRTRSGKPFGYNSVMRLLRDPMAKGLRRANYSKRLGPDNKTYIMKPESEWIYTRCPAIVCEELWDRCNAIIDEQLKKNKKATRKAVHLFTGVACCECGGRMYVPSNYPKYVCFKCRNKILMTDLEHIFQEQLKSFLFSDEEIANHLQQADTVIKEKEELLKSLDEEGKKVQTDLDRLIQLNLRGEIPSDGFRHYYLPLDERLKQIQAQTPELQAEVDFLKIQLLSSDEILHEAKDLYSRWPSLSAAEKRKIIETIAERITIGKNDIAIQLSYLPSPSSEVVAEGHQTPTDIRTRP